MVLENSDGDHSHPGTLWDWVYNMAIHRVVRRDIHVIIDEELGE